MKECRCNGANNGLIQKCISIHIKIRDENISRSSLALRALITFFGAVNTGLLQLCKDSINNGVVLINRTRSYSASKSMGKFICRGIYLVDIVGCKEFMALLPLIIPVVKTTYSLPTKLAFQTLF